MNKDEKEHDRFPKDFLKDIFIILHNFHTPERDEHLNFINYELKHDLFRDAYDRVLTNIHIQNQRSQPLSITIYSLMKNGSD